MFLVIFSAKIAVADYTETASDSVTVTITKTTDGVCGEEVYTCDAGTVVKLTPTAQKYFWYCASPDGGHASDTCTAPIPITEPTTNTCANGATDYPTCVNTSTNTNPTTPTPVMSGGVNASNCTISAGNSSCTTSISWSTTNPEATSAVTTPSNITVGTGNNGSKTYTVSYGSRTFYLYNNSKLLDQTTSSASCGTSATWDGSKCVASNNSMSGGVNASNCTISAGNSSCTTSISWSTTNPEATSAVTTPSNITVGTGNNGSKTYTVSYGSRTFYLYNNSKLLDQDTANASCSSSDTWDGSKCVVNSGAGAGAGTGAGSGTGSGAGSGSGTGTGVSIPPTVSLDILRGGVSIRIGNTTGKIPYNSKVGVSWSSSDANSCTLYSSDSKSGQVSLISSTNNKSTPYFSPGLKRDTTYTVTCKGVDGSQKSDFVKVLVSSVSAGYVEQ